MIAKVLHTFGSRFIMAVFSFVLLLLNSHHLGAEGLGTVGLLILNITIIVLLCNLLHGGLIYFSSRLNRGNLFIIAYAWLGISLLLYFLLQYIYPLLDFNLLKHVYLLGFLQAAAAIHFYFLIGKEKIKLYNLISLGQSAVLFAYVFIHYKLLSREVISVYIEGLYFSFGLSFVFAFLFSLQELQRPNIMLVFQDFKKCLSYGFYSQAANTFQLFNYRISYFFLDSFSGRTALGHYTASVQISEALLIPGRSISTVQYARISRKKHDYYARKISLFFMKISWMITLFGLLLILVLPEEFYIFLLGSEFTLVKQLILYMSIGILALSAEVVISHYFSGTGRVKINLYSAIIGFVVTLFSCFFFIPIYGAIGAAISTALSYSAMFLYLFYTMNQKSGIQKSMLLPTKQDAKLIHRIYRLWANSKSK